MDEDYYDPHRVEAREAEHTRLKYEGEIYNSSLEIKLAEIIDRYDEVVIPQLQKISEGLGYANHHLDGKLGAINRNIAFLTKCLAAGIAAFAAYLYYHQ